MFNNCIIDVLWVGYGIEMVNLYLTKILIATTSRFVVKAIYLMVCSVLIKVAIPSLTTFVLLSRVIL